MPKYRNTGTKPIHTGNGEVCLPGATWDTNLDMCGHPYLEKLKVTKKKAVKKK